MCRAAMKNTVWTEVKSDDVVSFGNIPNGTMFRYPHGASRTNIYMKVEFGANHFGALLTTGYCYHIEEHKQVEPVPKQETVCLKSV